MRRIIWIGLMLALTSVYSSVSAQTRVNRRSVAVTYVATVNNCNNREIVLDFSKELSRDLLRPELSSNNLFFQKLQQVNGADSISVIGKKVIVYRSNTVSAETVTANITRVVEQQFGWRVTRQGSIGFATYPCSNQGNRRSSRRSPPNPCGPDGPRRTLDGRPIPERNMPARSKDFGKP